MKLQQFHVCIQVSDFTRSLHFYQSLGFEPEPELRHEDNDINWQYLRHPDSDMHIELLHFRNSPGQGPNNVARQDWMGLNHIGFHVENLDKVKAALARLNVEVAEQGERNGYRFLFACGPDGEWLGFAEFDPP